MKTAQSDSIANALLILVGTLSSLFIVLFVLTLLRGWIVHLLWLWFVVPVFSVPLLTIGQSIGLSMLINFLTYHQLESQASKESNWEPFLTVLFYQFFVLGFGWLIHLFV